MGKGLSSNMQELLKRVRDIENISVDVEVPIVSSPIKFVDFNSEHFKYDAVVRLGNTEYIIRIDNTIRRYNSFSEYQIEEFPETFHILELYPYGKMISHVVGPALKVSDLDKIAKEFDNRDELQPILDELLRREL